MSHDHYRHPRYQSDANFNTNAPSYYEDLARKNKLLELLSKKIWEYDETLDNSLENINNVLDNYISIVDGKIEEIDHTIGEGFNDEINTLLVEWVNDGTLENIINVEIFNDLNERLAETMNKTIREYSVLNDGAVGDGVTDDTASIQQTIDVAHLNGGGIVDVPASSNPYMISPTSLNLKDNVYLRLQHGATLKMITNDLSNYQIVNIRDITNSGILGSGIIEGDRVTHTGTLGEHGHGIYIAGATNIYFGPITVKDCWGDGVYIGDTNVSKNVNMKEIICDNNRRQGISVTNIDGMTLIRPKLLNTNGTSPSAGLDIEPNVSTDVIDNIKIIDPYTENNEHSGIIVALNKLAAKKHTNIEIINHTDDGSAVGLTINKSAGGFTGRILVENPNYKKSGGNGIQVRDYDISGALIDIVNPIITKPNRNEKTDMQYGSGIAVYKESTDTTSTTIGNVKITNPIILDSEGLMLSSMMFRDFTGVLVKKCTVENPIDLGDQSPKLYAYGDVFVEDKFRQLYYQDQYGTGTMSKASMHRIVDNSKYESTRTVTFSNSFNIGNTVTFEVVLGSPIGMRIKPYTGEEFSIVGNGIDKYIQCLDVGGRITLKKINDTVWIPTEIIGEWTAEA